MAKDDAVRNQKVFISLESVIQLRGLLAQARSELKAIEQRPGAADGQSMESRKYWQGKRDGLERMIELMGLPIEIGRDRRAVIEDPMWRCQELGTKRLTRIRG